jgi:hypothetical protein
MTDREPAPADAALVAIDISKMRNDVLIEVPGAARPKRVTVLTITGLLRIASWKQASCCGSCHPSPSSEQCMLASISCGPRCNGSGACGGMAAGCTLVRARRLVHPHRRSATDTLVADRFALNRYPAQS